LHALLRGGEASRLRIVSKIRVSASIPITGVAAWFRKLSRPVFPPGFSFVDYFRFARGYPKLFSNTAHTQTRGPQSVSGLDIHLNSPTCRRRRERSLPAFVRKTDALVGYSALLQSPPEGETTLANLFGIVMQLKRERDRVQQQLWGLNAALEAFAGVYRGNNGIKPRRKISAKGRATIAAAQRARWAKVKGNKATAAKPVKRSMSASSRRKIAAAQRKRWSKVKRERKAA
jgi:hypothetical protein